MSCNFKRILSLTLTVMMLVSCLPVSAFATDECAHEGTIINNTATCVAEGENIVSCSACGVELERTPAAATGVHNYVDGVCTVCSAEEVVVPDEEEGSEEEPEFTCVEGCILSTPEEHEENGGECLVQTQCEKDPACIQPNGHEGACNTGVATYDYVAKIGEQGYETLAAAIAAATAGQTITLVADVTEDVTVSKAVTIDGANKTYTGKMTLSADTTIKNVNFDGKGYNGYAVETRGANYLTVEDCTAKNYGYGFIQIASATDLTTVKNVTASNMNYGVKVDYSNTVVLENVDITAAVAAVLNSNYGEKTITIKDSKLNIYGTWTRNNTIKTNIVFEGANTVNQFISEEAIDIFKLSAGATLTAPNTVTVITDVEDHEVKYVDGAYSVVEKINAVAKIGEQGYETLAAALAAATAGQTITLVADVTENVTVSKAVTIDGANKTYTGAMTLRADTTIKNVNFDGKGYNGYAVETRGANYLTVEDCTAKNYGYGFIQLASATVLTTVKNVTASNMNYGVKIDYSNAVVLENVDITAGVAAVLNSNYGEKPITIKDSKLNIYGTWTRNDTVKTNIVFEGENTVDKFIAEEAIDNFKLASGATLTAPEGLNITTDVEDYVVNYNEGKYALTKAFSRGTWGGIDWELNELTGTLTISPTAGEPVADKNAPTKRTYEVGEWRETVVYKSNGSASEIGGAPYDMKAVKKLIIKEGVTTIGSFTAQFPNLTGEVVIPYTVTYIGQEAFHKAPITKLTFAEGGTEGLCIANGAFKKTQIEEVSFPGDREYIHVHHWAFGGSTNLKSAYIPANVIKTWGGEHVDYFDNFNSQTNVTWAEYGSIFTGCTKMETITFENEAARDLFFAKNRQSTNEDYIVAYVGLTAYNTIAKAVDEANTGDAIVLINNVTENVSIDKPIKLELNDKKYNGTITLTDLAATLTAPAGLNVITDIADYKVVYNEGVYSVTYVYEAKIGETKYETVEEALAVAVPGETVELLVDIADLQYLAIWEDITLDLNGKTLEATYVTCFGDIVDSSKENSGVLNVNEKRFMLREDNEQLPVKSNGGYKFVEVLRFNAKMSSKEADKFVFQPVFEPAAHELILQGAKASGVTINVRVTWQEDTGVRSQNFVYSDEQVEKVIGSYDPDTGEYGNQFNLRLANAANFDGLSFEVVVLSDTKVSAVSVPVTLTK